jgi:hypothetical protein
MLQALAVALLLNAPIAAIAQQNEDRMSPPNPSDVNSLKSKPILTQQDLVKHKVTAFDLLPNDEIIEIDGKAVNPVEATAQIHTSGDLHKEITVRRNGKILKLKAKKSAADKKTP